MNEKQAYRKIIFFKDYFQTFFEKQNKKVKAKIVWTFDLIEDLQRVPETQKTPKKEIELALKIKAAYENEKQ